MANRDPLHLGPGEDIASAPTITAEELMKMERFGTALPSRHLMPANEGQAETQTHVADSTRLAVANVFGDNLKTRPEQKKSVSNTEHLELMKEIRLAMKNIEEMIKEKSTISFQQLLNNLEAIKALFPDRWQSVVEFILNLPAADRNNENFLDIIVLEFAALNDKVQALKPKVAEVL